MRLLHGVLEMTAAAALLLNGCATSFRRVPPTLIHYDRAVVVSRHSSYSASEQYMYWDVVDGLPALTVLPSWHYDPGKQVVTFYLLGDPSRSLITIEGTDARFNYASGHWSRGDTLSVLYSENLRVAYRGFSPPRGLTTAQKGREDIVIRSIDGVFLD